MKQFTKQYQLWIAVKEVDPKSKASPLYQVEEYDTPQAAFDAALGKSTGDLAITEKFEFDIIPKSGSSTGGGEQSKPGPSAEGGIRPELGVPPPPPTGGATVVELQE